MLEVEALIFEVKRYNIGQDSQTWRQLIATVRTE